MAVTRIPRTPANEELPDDRRQDFRPVDLGFSAEQAKAEASRCLHCTVPGCRAACPVNVDIPEFIAHLSEGDEAGALSTILSSNLLPSVCGRVCPQERQCEGSCILGRKDPAGAVSIGQLERYLGDRAPELGITSACAPATGKKVAVVGSGPAGLACAGELARRGHTVEVLESFHMRGGVLAYGIPNFRLPKTVLARELDNLEKLGVTFRTDFLVGRYATVPELLGDEFGFDAVFIGVGAGLPQFLGIPGESFAGSMTANEFLTRVNLVATCDKPTFGPEAGPLPVGPGNEVIVIGGGNVAMDAARTALRLGAKSVRIVYRRSEAEMPARKLEVEHAHAEGIDFHTLTAPLEVLGDERGRVVGLRCQKMALGEPDASGRRRPVAIEGSEEVLACDTVIVAIGTRANPMVPLAVPGAKLTERGYLECDETGRTTVEGVWAGGDIVTGSATVILAMGAGRKAAASIDEYLTSR